MGLTYAILIDNYRPPVYNSLHKNLTKGKHMASASAAGAPPQQLFAIPTWEVRLTSQDERERWSITNGGVKDLLNREYFLVDQAKVRSLSTSSCVIDLAALTLQERATCELQVMFGTGRQVMFGTGSYTRLQMTLNFHLFFHKDLSGKRVSLREQQERFRQLTSVPIIHTFVVGGALNHYEECLQTYVRIYQLAKETFPRLPAIKPPEPPVLDMANLMQDPTLVTIKTEDVTYQIPCKLLGLPHTGRFSQVFASGFQEATTRIVELDEPPEVGGLFAKYLYGQPLTLTPEQDKYALALLRLADRYEIEPLKLYCQEGAVRASMTAADPEQFVSKEALREQLKPLTDASNTAEIERVCQGARQALIQTMSAFLEPHIPRLLDGSLCHEKN